MTEPILQEKWKAIEGYEDFYEVSSLGRVRSVDRVVERRTRFGVGEMRVRGKILSPGTSPEGYLKVSLCTENVSRSCYIHRMVLEAFVSPCPEGMEACHNDGDRLNNAVENLRWDTRANNHADKVKHGTDNRGERHYGAKLAEADVVEIKRQIAADNRRGLCVELAREHGVSPYTIYDIANGKNWSHVTAEAR
jgi:hypothetical protein